MATGQFGKECEEASTGKILPWMTIIHTTALPMRSL